MIARRFALAAIKSFAFLALATLSKPLLAQEAAPPDVENAQYQIEGEINSTAFVRSGASDTDYPTLKLEKGERVTVVGERFTWLKILPPKGSFCYVSRAHVNRTGNGSIGIVAGPLNVRIGSALNALKTKVADVKLNANQRVEIVGEEDEYFKVTPPAGVFFYINKQYVDPVRHVPLADQQPAEQQQQASKETPNLNPPATQPGEQPTEQTAVNPTSPATQPSADAQKEFDRLEASYADASQKPLDQQPLEELLAGYQKLADAGALPESMHRIVDFKISVLKTRVDLKQQYVETKKNQEEANRKTVILKQEETELKQRVKENDIQFYTAVGTLRTSSLQQGQPTLYRLTDPGSGRTVIYLRSDDQKINSLLGEFIGVRGEVSTDSQISLRTITPTAVEVISAGKVGTSIVAQIVPASLLPSGTASGAGE